MKKNKNFEGKDLRISSVYPFKVDESRGVHTNPDGSEVSVTVVTNDMYFNKRSKEKHKLCKGNSWLFPNHVEYSGWLWMNGRQSVELEELEERWS